MHFEKMTQNIFLESVKTRQKSQKKTLDKIPTLCYNIRVLRSDAPREPAVLAQLDRVPGYEPVGRGFESLTPCQRKAIRNSGWLFLCMVLWDETPVQVAGKTRTFLSAATEGSGAQLDAELARRGSESLTPCQNKSPMACPWDFCFITVWAETLVQVPFLPIPIATNQPIQSPSAKLRRPSPARR